jgi:general stress protein 26
MELAAERKIWKLIKDEDTALLITVRKDGSFDSRLMGCVQREFDGRLWFLILKDSPKSLDVERNQHALVSYTRPSSGEFVSISGRARLIDNSAQVHAFWSEALRVWFPDGPESSNLALLAIEVEVAKLWTKPTSYTYYYLRTRPTGDLLSQIKERETAPALHAAL